MGNDWNVVKVGGSLFDLPDLRARLQSFLRQLDGVNVLLVPGGGVSADAIRTFDRMHHLGEEAAHWLAIQALSVNARFLQALLPESRLQSGLADISGSADPHLSWQVLDPCPFFLDDERRVDHLPHCWDVTSDSLAVRTAVLFEARELILLKSAPWKSSDWSDASKVGFVDGYFATALKQAHERMRVRAINLRDSSC